MQWPDSYLQELPPLEAFARIGEFLWSLREARHCPELGRLKVDCVEQLLSQTFTRDPEDIRRFSLRALAAGLLCGALEGAGYFLACRPPGPWPEHPDFEITRERLEQAWTTARQSWPQMAVDDLQLQSAYGKHLNRATEQENVEFLQPDHRHQGDFRRALLETYRTGYSLGLIDSAIVFLGGQLPDRL